MDEAGIIKTIFAAIDTVNSGRSAEEKVSKTVDTILSGPSSEVDSMGIIDLILAIESALEDQFDVIIALADANAMDLEESPFRTVKTLAGYILKRVQEESHG